MLLLNTYSDGVYVEFGYKNITYPYGHLHSIKPRISKGSHSWNEWYCSYYLDTNQQVLKN